MTSNYELVIGDKNYSSWSLRPWLILTAFELPFSQINIKLRRPETREDILRHSPSGKVPALRIDDLMVWDSLAIMELLAERHPNMAIWPSEWQARAIARSVSAEMHSGFFVLRDQCPMDFNTVHGLPDTSEKLLNDVRRIITIWKDCRSRFGDGGPYLFGQFSAADAMYAPVVSRLVSYAFDLSQLGDDGTAAAYRDAMMAMPEMQRWSKEAAAEEALRAEPF